MTKPKKSNFVSRRVALSGLRTLVNKSFGSAAKDAVIKALEPFPFVGTKKAAKGGKIKK